MTMLERAGVALIVMTVLVVVAEITFIQYGVDPQIAPNHQWFSIGDPI